MYARKNESWDSQQRPLGNVNYQAPHDDAYAGGRQYPMGSGGKKRRSKWLTIGLPLLLIAIIVGAVLGGVLGTRGSHNNNASTSSSGSGSSGSGSTGSTGSGTSGATGQATGAGTNAGKATNQVLFTGYNDYGVPQYPETAAASYGQAPSVSNNASLGWGTDPNAPTANGLNNVRQDHPRLFAPAYKWARLPALIAADPYMAAWNKTIFDNATAFYNMAPTNYSIDGGYSGSGVLDVAREVQLRIKHWAYAYRMSNDTKWVDRTWREVVVASGNDTSTFFGRAGNNWNTECVPSSLSFSARAQF